MNKGIEDGNMFHGTVRSLKHMVLLVFNSDLLQINISFDYVSICSFLIHSYGLEKKKKNRI